MTDGTGGWDKFPRRTSITRFRYFSVKLVSHEGLDIKTDSSRSKSAYFETPMFASLSLESSPESEAVHDKQSRLAVRSNIRPFDAPRGLTSGL